MESATSRAIERLTSAIMATDFPGVVPATAAMDRGMDRLRFVCDVQLFDGLTLLFSRVLFWLSR